MTVGNDDSGADRSAEPAARAGPAPPAMPQLNMPQLCTPQLCTPQFSSTTTGT